jgi:hypothetical protein
MNTPAQSPAKEMVISPCREWWRGTGPNVLETGQSLSCGLGGVVGGGNDGENAAGVISGVNALNWSQAIYKSAPNYDYDMNESGDPSPAWPMVYGTDSTGSMPGAGDNYWPGGVGGGGPAATPGAESMMWLFDQPGCVGSYPNTPGDTAYPRQYFFRFCQASWWVYLKGWLSQIQTPDPNTPGLMDDWSMTYAYRGRYKLDHYRNGFRANCELWAFNSNGEFGWDDYDQGVAEGVPDYYIGVMARNVSLVAAISVAPGIYREVPIPTGTTGSGSLAGGFLGLATFEVWGITWAAWKAATGLGS